MTSSYRFTTTALLLGSTLAASLLTGRREPQALAHPLNTVDRQFGGWKATDDAPLAPNIVESLGSTSYISRTYRSGSKSINLFIAFYANQRAGESMHSPRHCLPGGGWELVEYGNADIPAGAYHPRVNNFLLIKPGDRSRMLYWYQGKYRVTASEYTSKVYLVWDSMRRGTTSGSIVRVLLADEPGALEDGVEFSRQLIPQVARCFGS